MKEGLVLNSHDTAVIGWKDGVVAFMKTYNYEIQKDEAQADLKAVIDAGLQWRIGQVGLLVIAEVGDGFCAQCNSKVKYEHTYRDMYIFCDEMCKQDFIDELDDQVNQIENE